jgi:hypothetical protein
MYPGCSAQETPGARKSANCLSVSAAGAAVYQVIPRSRKQARTGILELRMDQACELRKQSP